MHDYHSKWRKPKKSRKRKRNAANKENIKKYWKNKSEKSTSQNQQSLGADKSTTEKKLSFFEKSDESSCAMPDQYFLVHSSTFQNLLPKCYCENCEQVSTVTFNSADRKGFAHLFQLVCDNCEEVVTKTFSSKRLTANKKSSFDVNHRVVDSFLKIGAGYSSALDFCASMKLDPMNSSAYYSQINSVKKDAQELKKNILQKSREVVRNVHKSLSVESIKESDVIDILCSFDGSWPKRGHTSLYGIGCVIDVLTGLVIDYEVLSKYCHSCTRAATDLEADSPEFSIWQEGHKDSGDCCENYSGSSGAMEMKSAEIIWKRSVKECRMRYTTLLSDGDSKTLKHLLELSVYDRPIKKEECLNHVSKRLFTALTELVKTCKVKGITLGGKKKGALTAQIISRLSNYYRSAIIRNKSSVTAMRKDILSTLSHCSSTDQEYDHSDCPSGVSSWCFFNRALAKKINPPSHDTMKIRLSKEVVEYMKPIYVRLTQDELLQRCTKGLTQNANESLHSVIWNKCPKTKFVSKGRVEFAVANGIAEFNMGKLAAAESLADVRSDSVSAVTEKVLKKKDQLRKRLGEYKEQPESKRQKMNLKYRKRTKEYSNKKNEEPSYGAGLF